MTMARRECSTLGLSAKTGGDGILFGFEYAQVRLNPVDSDARAPVARRLVPSNAVMATRIMGPHNCVPRVFRRRNGSQVAPSVIAPNPVRMVNLIDGPVADHPCPYDSVGFVITLQQVASPIPLRVNMVQSGLTCELSIPDFGSGGRRKPIWPEDAGVACAPSHDTSRWVIIEKIAEFFRTGYRAISHVVSPHVRGQGRAALTRCFRPDFLPKIYELSKELGRASSLSCA